MGVDCCLVLLGRRFSIVLFVLYAIFMLVCLKDLVINLVSGPM